MGLVTIHLVVGVGILILILFLSFFSYSTLMSLANLYIIVGAISFVTSIVTAIVLVTKFINQPVAHGFFSYSDILASALLSMGMLLDGFIPFTPSIDVPCYQYSLVYGLFIVPIVTSFFSVLGMAIERFQAFAVYRDTSVMSKKFSIAWFVASWLIAVCMVVILLGQLNDRDEPGSSGGDTLKQISGHRKFVLASQIFPGPHSQTLAWSSETVIISSGTTTTLLFFITYQYFPGSDPEDAKISNTSISSVSNLFPGLVIEEGYIEDDDSMMDNNQTLVVGLNDTLLANDELFPDEDILTRSGSGKMMTTRNINSSDCAKDHNAVCIEPPAVIKSSGLDVSEPRCAVKSDKFIMYYFTLLFLLCFATPVLITTSLNVYITSAVRGTHYDNISNHQWLTLIACVVMWCPCLIERMLSKWGLLTDRLPVAVFLFLLGHTHNLLRLI